MLRHAILVIVLGMLTLTVPFGAQAAPSPPEPFAVTWHVSSKDPSGCPFDVTVTATGKAKTITTPTGKVIGISAQTVATATNDSTGKSVSYSINGTFITTTDANGNVTTKATGVNFLSDPTYNLVVTSGNYSFTFDKKGNLVQGLNGTGSTTDVCAALA